MPLSFTQVYVICAALAGALASWQLSQFFRRDVPRIPRWDITVVGFIETGLCVAFGALFTQALVLWIARRIEPSLNNDEGLLTLVGTAAFQGGVLLGLLGAQPIVRMIEGAWDKLREPTLPSPPETPPRLGTVQAIRWGAIAFVAVLPVVFFVSLLWTIFLEKLGVEIEPQSLVEFFRNNGSRVENIAMTFCAVVLAPLTEELIFRAGLFRYLRSRIPRGSAIVLTSALFAVLHWTLGIGPQLFVLGVCFALVYERTGNVITPIVAHGLFNLNTLLLVAAGVD